MAIMFWPMSGVAADGAEGDIVAEFVMTCPAEMDAANTAETPPTEKESEGEDQENQPGEADRPPEHPIGEMAAQPDSDEIGPEARIAMASPSFLNGVSTTSA